MRKQALRAHHLHADIQDLVYIYIPDGFPGAGEVALLVKGLYRFIGDDGECFLLLYVDDALITANSMTQRISWALTSTHRLQDPHQSPCAPSPAT
jgi:hypothetical protein